MVRARTLCNSSWGKQSLLRLTVAILAATVTACGSSSSSVQTFKGRDFGDISVQRPPADFGFMRVRAAQGHCYQSAVVSDPGQAVDRLRDYYLAHGFGGIPAAGPSLAKDQCEFRRHPEQMVPPRRPNAYGWQGNFSPGLGDLLTINAWVVPVHPSGPARIFLAVWPCVGCNLP